jgi:hypothetical protein
MADDIDPDSGIDAGKDSPADGKTDTGADSGKMDSGVDTGIDTGVDSGDDADDDGGDGAVDAAPDASMDGGSMCKLGIGFGSVSMNGCSSGQQWTCGNDSYQYECFCPGLACVCTKNNVPVQKVVAQNGCPSCNFNSPSIAQLCGFPY